MAALKTNQSKIQQWAAEWAALPAQATITGYLGEKTIPCTAAALVAAIKTIREDADWTHIRIGGKDVAWCRQRGWPVSLQFPAIKILWTESGRVTGPDWTDIIRDMDGSYVVRTWHGNAIVGRDRSDTLPEAPSVYGDWIGR